MVLNMAYKEYCTQFSSGVANPSPPAPYTKWLDFGEFKALDEESREYCKACGGVDPFRCPNGKLLQSEPHQLSNSQNKTKTDDLLALLASAEQGSSKAGWTCW
jgi:hypothetical protein